MGNEIKLFKNEEATTEFDFEKKLKAYTKVFFNSCLKADAKATDKIPYISYTSDSKYLYLHSELEGLLKIGTGFEYTMLGKVYAHKPDFRIKERGTLAFIYTDGRKGRLFYRSPKVTKQPLIEIDPETLTEMDTKFDVD